LKFCCHSRDIEDEPGDDIGDHLPILGASKPDWETVFYVTGQDDA
jgi:hypothetical protein